MRFLRIHQIFLRSLKNLKWRFQNFICVMFFENLNDFTSKSLQFKKWNHTTLFLSEFSIFRSHTFSSSFYYNFFGKYISKVCKVYSEEFSIGNGRFNTFVSAHKAICYGCSAQSLIIFKEVPYPHSGTLQHQANLKGFFRQFVENWSSIKLKVLKSFSFGEKQRKIQIAVFLSKKKKIIINKKQNWRFTVTLFNNKAQFQWIWAGF